MDLLFVHGWAGSRELWDPAILRLGTRHPCLALDLPGHGENAGRDNSNPRGDGAHCPDGTVLEELADHVADIARTWAGRPVTVVGHSMGTAVALLCALRHPDAVAGLVLAGPAHPDHVLWGLRRLMAHPRLAGAAIVLTRVTARASGSLAPAHGGGRMASALRRHRAAGRASVATLERTLRAVTTTDFPSRLGDVRVPVLIVAGTWDLQARASGARALAGALPDARLVVLPRIGHHPMIECPDVFVALVEDWLERVEGTAPRPTS